MSAASKPPKVSAYAKRNLNSIAAPIEDDSDPDFKAGPVEQEAKKSKSKGKGARRKPVRDSMDSDESDKPAKKKRKTKESRRRNSRPKVPGLNPLLEFFKSSDIESDAEVKLNNGPSYESDDDGHDDGSEADEGPAPTNKLTAFLKPKAPTPSPAHGSTTEDDTCEELPTGTIPKPLPNYSSATESDSSDAYLRPASKPDSSPRKRLKTSISDSVTESDSDVANSCTAPTSANREAGSDTEPDSDYDGPAPIEQRPRPGFPLAPDQKPLGAMVLDAAEGIKVPAAINTYLRPYQRDGIKFFWERYNEGRGGLLGDDMGKTIQVISFLSAIMKKDGVKTDRNRRHKHVSELQDGKEWKKNKKLPPPNATWATCLIIAPTSVVFNWEREFGTWGYFEGRYVGTPAERAPVLEDFKKGRLDVVLTSHHTARRDIDLLDSLDWSCVIIDEVHSVKNPASKTAQAFGSFDCMRRFGLTGTAIQNSYEELYTILDWTNPGKLGTIRQWRQAVSVPLLQGQSAAATDQQRYNAVTVSKILNTKLLPRFFLRRMKEIIAHQMPKKTDQVVFCPLTPIQISVYKKILAMPELRAVLKRDDPCECGSQKPRKKCCDPYNPSTIFKFLTILIKLSNHMGLILPSPGDTPEQLTRNREWASVAFPKGDAPISGLAILDDQYCGKWAVLTSLLKEWKEERTNNKVLIFTKSVKLLEMMTFQLDKSSYKFLKLDGGTKHTDRMGLIDEFHQDPSIFIFLISTMAGGTGLNLTGANKVVIFDPNWNPAHDLQAMDRAFRMGQTRDVSVFRLLGAGAVEELIYSRQVYKQQQMQIGYEASIQTRYFEGIQGDKSRQGELFGLKNIFKLHESGFSTKMTIEKAHIAQLNWKLQNMDIPRPKSKQDDIDVADIESQVEDDFKGLGALLFTDALPKPDAPVETGSKAVMKGMYTHHNPELLVASKIEQEITKDIVKRARRKSRKSTTNDEASPSKPWPPPRLPKKKKAAPSTIKFEDRLKALIGTGMITSPDDLADFAHNFTQKYSAEEQAYTLQLLDNYHEDSGDSGGDEADMEVEVEAEDIDM